MILVLVSINICGLVSFWVTYILAESYRVKELLGPIQGLKKPTHLSNPWLNQTKYREGKVMGFPDSSSSAPFQPRTVAPQLLIHRHSEMSWCLVGICGSQRLLWLLRIYSLWHKGSYQNAIIQYTFCNCHHLCKNKETVNIIFWNLG